MVKDKRVQVVVNYPRVVVNAQSMPRSAWQEALTNTKPVDYYINNYCAFNMPHGEPVLIAGNEWVERHAPSGSYKGFSVIATKWHVIIIVPKYDENGFPILVQFPDDSEPVATVRYN